MLVSFTLANYRSFHAPVMLSMCPFSRLTGEERLDTTHLIETKCPACPKLVKSAAVYGANASGKSNLLKGLLAMKKFVQSSLEQFRPKRRLPIHDPFEFDEKSKNAPSHFDVQFIINGDLFRYGFEVSEYNVESEWLERNGETLFYRSAPDSFDIEDAFPEGNELAEKTGAGALFLSVCTSFNGKISGLIASEFFDKIGDFEWIDGTEVLFRRQYAKNIFADKELLRSLNDIVRRADTGIDELVPTDVPIEVHCEVFIQLPVEAPSKRMDRVFNSDVPAGGESNEKSTTEKRQMWTLRAKHKDGTLFPLDQLSDGTRKLIDIVIALIRAIKTGKILVIDELDIRLHSHLLEMLLDLFHAKGKYTSQMVFTTHNTYPLRRKMLRRDQVWFLTKGPALDSELTNLAQYKIRTDASYEKDYLGGRFAGVPNIELADIFHDAVSDVEEYTEEVQE